MEDLVAATAILQSKAWYEDGQDSLAYQTLWTGLALQASFSPLRCSVLVCRLLPCPELLIVLIVD